MVPLSGAGVPPFVTEDLPLRLGACVFSSSLAAPAYDGIMWFLAARVVSNISSVITMLVFLVGTSGHPCVAHDGVCGAAEPAALAWWRIILAGDAPSAVELVM
jgi:hypothetical protein